MRAQQSSIILIYLAELFLLRNEIIVAIRKKICTLPSSIVAPRSPRGCEKITHSNLLYSRGQVTFSARKYLRRLLTLDFARGRGKGVDVVVLSTFWNAHIFRDW